MQAGSLRYSVFSRFNQPFLEIIDNLQKEGRR